MKKAILVLMLVMSIAAMGTPSVSSWDGVANPVKEFLNKNANDPKSIKYQEKSGVFKHNHGYAQRVDFRGKNAFGGTVLNSYIFFMEKVNGKYVVTETAPFNK